MCGKRRNATHVFRVQWTLDDAKRAGIAGNPAYAKYPRQMLLARASAELVRQMCPEVLGGITLFSEEAVDIEPDDLPVIGPTLPAKAPAKPSETRKRSRASKPPEPTQPPLEAVPDDTDDAPTEAQTKLAMAAFNEQNLGDRDDRIRATTAIIGRNYRHLERPHTQRSIHRHRHPRKTESRRHRLDNRHRRHLANHSPSTTTNYSHDLPSRA